MRGKQKRIPRVFGTIAMIFLMGMLFGTTAMASDRVENISIGRTVINQDKDASIVHYYKFTVKTAGRLTLSGVAEDEKGDSITLTVCICNAKGKVLLTEHINANSPLESLQYLEVGLNKGTYKLKITTPYEYRIVTDFQKWTEKSGANQKKAVFLKKNKMKTGIVGLGESSRKYDWYKITLKKDSTLLLAFSASANSTLRATFIPSKSTGITNKLSLEVQKGTISQRFALKGGSGLPAGTYYVKVERVEKNSAINGVYCIHWVK
jgi:hypothetical protein